MESISRTLDLAPGNEAEVVRRNLSRLAASKQPNFLGVHPRDIVQEDLLKFSNGFVDFVWSYKADGIRGLISIVRRGLEEIWYFTDRRNETYILSRTDIGDATRGAASDGVCAVFDAELVQSGPESAETIPTGSLTNAGNGSLSLYCFDLLTWAHTDWVHKPFWKRHQELARQFPVIDLAHIRPAHEGYQLASHYGGSILSCSVWTKAVSHEAIELTRATPPEDVAGCDGIILHQRNCAYFQRDMVTCYRWKPPRALSVDLLTRQRDKTTNGEARYDLLAWIGKGKHAQLNLGLKVVGIPHCASQERLAEFIIDPEQNLSFVRWRDDKFCANHLAQVRRTLAQQKDPITWANLLEVVRSAP